MKKDWTKVISEITEDFNRVDQLKCPNCGECGIDYMYVGDGHTRIGFLLIWCNKCLKGIHVSRAAAPRNAKFVTFETDLKSVVPEFELD